MMSVELRPPRSRLSLQEGMDVWIDLHHSIGQLARRDIPVFITDNAVGSEEEENLTHLSYNLGREVGYERVVPFLTCKHTLEYCLMFARRAASLGFPALTVLGGDASVGPPRCVAHAEALRALIRNEVPELTLGGWANPHRGTTLAVPGSSRPTLHRSSTSAPAVAKSWLRSCKRGRDISPSPRPGR